MRLALRLLLAAGLLPAVLVGASAYQAAHLEARVVSVEVVADSASYLAVAANGAHAYDCLVGTSGGEVFLQFDGLDAGCASAQAGTGINAGDGSDTAKYARYAFHDLLLVTNKGTRAVKLWVNATTDANAAGAVLDVAKKTTAATMTDADYAQTSATALDLSVGAVAYVGVRAKSGTLASGNSIGGTILVTARGA